VLRKGLNPSFEIDSLGSSADFFIQFPCVYSGPQQSAEEQCARQKSYEGEPSETYLWHQRRPMKETEEKKKRRES
jgi:hypothetical protein